MLNLLGHVCHDQVYKIKTIEESSCNINIDHISNKYDLIYIDAEHTKAAVKKDFDFSLKVINDKGAIILHDFWIIKDAIVDIEKSLRKSGNEHMGVYFGGEIFCFFFDVSIVQNDDFISKIYNDNPFKWDKMFTHECRKRLIPKPLLKMIRSISTISRKVK